MKTVYDDASKVLEAEGLTPEHWVTFDRLEDNIAKWKDTKYFGPHWEETLQRWVGYMVWNLVFEKYKSSEPKQASKYADARLKEFYGA